MRTHNHKGMNLGIVISKVPPGMRRKLARPYESAIRLCDKLVRKSVGLHYLWFHKPYSLEKAREYWSYPPSKLYGKRHTQDYCQEDDSFIKNLIESEIALRDLREDAEVARSRVKYWIENNNIQKMLDFGCGLGVDGVYFSTNLGIQVTFADISLPNVKLIDRYAQIWNILTKSVYIDDATSFDFGDKFDLIYANGVLHHIPEPKPVVDNLKRFLNSDGLFIVMLYTQEHYVGKSAENIYHYAVRSEAPAPIAITNPYSDYYDTAKAVELFEGCSLIDQWATNRNRFGWYCFKYEDY